LAEPTYTFGQVPSGAQRNTCTSQRHNYFGENEFNAVGNPQFSIPHGAVLFAALTNGRKGKTFYVAPS
jgi:hypothetical protein